MMTARIDVSGGMNDDALLQPFPRPSMVHHHSNSLPPSPRQHARNLNRRSRTPSPSRQELGHTPRSATSESNRVMPSLRSTHAGCRFQSTQTSRRRMPYTIGTDPLEVEPQPLYTSLDEEGDKILSASMRRLYEKLLPTQTSEGNRAKVVDKIRCILREDWPDRDVQVSIFGSSGNLLYTNQSDVDICITVQGLETVCELAELLANKGLRNVTCVHAKSVPIVKIWDPEFEVACDLNVNNLIALRNTDMVKAYMGIDERVRPLAMIVKYWAGRRTINEASGGTLSSYTWTLLVINFLQTRPTPLLPVFSLTDHGGQPKTSFAGDLDRDRGFGQENDESIGQLLFHFFRRYGHEIDFDTSVVSVRRGTLITKKEKNWQLATNNRLCVEEPFNIDRNLANTADDTAFRGLHLELRRAFSLIATAKDLVANVCEQYQFPVEGSRTIFERPQPQPRPTLSRSASQSGRANRGGSRGNRRGQDGRTGPMARRSSSAAAFGHTSFPNIQGSQIEAPPPDLLLQQRQTNSFSSDELSRLSRQISVEQQHLRTRQAQLAQAQLQQSLSGPHAQASHASLPRLPRQLHSNGYTGQGPIAPDLGPPGSAPLYAPYPLGPQFDSPGPTSYATSQQGTSTNPSSPLLTPITPYRRTLQRAPQASSPGRSHSQPARPLAPQLRTASGARIRYPQMTMPALPSTATRSAYIGPYMGPYGAYYVPMPTAESLPREYLGYGIGGEPQSGSPSQTQTPAQVPASDDGLQLDEHLMPLQATFSLVPSVPDLPKSPSLLDVSPRASGNLHPISTEADLEPHVLESHFRMQELDAAVPTIVNGSNVTTDKLRVAPSKSGCDDRRGSDPTPAYSRCTDRSATPSDLRRSPQSFVARVGASLAQQEQRRQEVQRPNFLNAEELDEPITVISKPTESPAMGSANGGVAPSGRPPIVGFSEQGKSPEAKMPSMPETARWARRATGNVRSAIPPLDLGTSITNTDHSLETRASGKYLSPVQETRTPSPTSTRAHGKSTSVHLNGTIGTRTTALPRLEDAFPQLAAPPSPRYYKGDQSGTNGSVKKPSAVPSPRAEPPMSPTQGQQQNNPWQQAGKGKKKTTKKGQEEKKGSGQTMPENVADRKGG